ncbi:AMP-binding protein [Nesterenkonia alba]|uniref:AMP-binding protein n=1 Tax=Nesterenkonia alba TaxID=515814 RepID=UPI0003B5A921|nr:AMP-binding protein [Nesterenkonia alba]
MRSWIPAALEAVKAAADGGAPPVEFLPAEAGVPRWVPRPEVLSEETERPAVVVRTSGSTGTPKQTLLTAENLRASAEATAQRLGGHGQWLVTLQPSYVAGLAVLFRSLQAGTTPVALLEHTTDPQRFTDAAVQLSAPRRYVSLVPTQLHRLLARADDRLLAVLRRFDAILLGGGATPAPLRERADQLGLRVVRTYGMSETCGGCVYDGVPLSGVQVGIHDSGRVQITGEVVAAGYTDAELTAARFDVDPTTGARRFLTDDLGTLQDGILSITGRADDVINTGGVKVSAEQIRQALLRHPAVQDAFVTGVDDATWGQRVAAVVVPGENPPATGGEGITGQLTGWVREQLGPAAAPKQYVLLADLPLLSTGKPDRQRLKRLLAEQ